MQLLNESHKHAFIISKLISLTFILFVFPSISACFKSVNTNHLYNRAKCFCASCLVYIMICYQSLSEEPIPLYSASPCSFLNRCVTSQLKSCFKLKICKNHHFPRLKLYRVICFYLICFKNKLTFLPNKIFQHIPFVITINYFI